MGKRECALDGVVGNHLLDGHYEQTPLPNREDESIKELITLKS